MIFCFELKLKVPPHRNNYIVELFFHAVEVENHGFGSGINLCNQQGQIVNDNSSPVMAYVYRENYEMLLKYVGAFSPFFDLIVVGSDLLSESLLGRLHFAQFLIEVLRVYESIDQHPKEVGVEVVNEFSCPGAH